MNQALQYLKDQGVTVKEAAQKVGYGPIYLYQLMSGSTPMNDKAMYRLTKAFPGIEQLLSKPVACSTRLNWLKRTLEIVGTTATDDCIAWPFTCNSADGRPRMRVGYRRELASRVAYELYYGRVPEQYVLHTCDNPLCVNPLHLYQGDAAQNMRDWLERGTSIYTIARNGGRVTRTPRNLQPPKVKGRPGRPRIHPPKEKVPGRKRGRPRKH